MFWKLDYFRQVKKYSGFERTVMGLDPGKNSRAQPEVDTEQ